MTTLLIAIGIALLASILTTTLLSVVAFRGRYDRPRLLMAALLGWLGLAAVLIFITRTRLPRHFDDLLASVRYAPVRSPAVVETSGVSKDAAQASPPLTADRQAELDRILGISASYQSLIAVKSGRIRRSDYEKLGSARRTLLRLRLQEASATGDAVALQALRDVRQWDAAKP